MLQNKNPFSMLRKYFVEEYFLMKMEYFLSFLSRDNVSSSHKKNVLDSWKYVPIQKKNIVIFT